MDILKRELYASEIVLNLLEDEIHNLNTAFKVCKRESPPNANREYIYLKMYVLGCIYYEATKPVGNAQVPKSKLYSSAQMHVDAVIENVVEKINKDGTDTYWGASKAELLEAIESYPPMYQHVDPNEISKIFMNRLDDTGSLNKLIDDNFSLEEVFKGIVRNTYENLYNKMEAFQNDNKLSVWEVIKIQHNIEHNTSIIPDKEYMNTQIELAKLVNSTTDDTAYKLKNLDSRDFVMAEYIALKFSFCESLAEDIYTTNSKKARLLLYSVMSQTITTNTGLYERFNEEFLCERAKEYNKINDERVCNSIFFKNIGKDIVPDGYESFAMDCYSYMQQGMSKKVEYDSLEHMAKKSDGCYIATAVYGSYDCPQVWVLRRFRDKILYNNILGRAFIKIYYDTSPLLVKQFGSKVWFNIFFKNVLNYIIWFLMHIGFSDKPYNKR